MFALAGAAEAIIIHGFPIFGIINGEQAVRINAVLQQPPEPDMPCPVTMTLIDSQGRTIGDPNTFELRGGAAVATDFVGNPEIRIGARTRRALSPWLPTRKLGAAQSRAD